MAHERLMNYFNRRLLMHQGFMGEVPRRIYPEGNRGRMIREDGSHDEATPKRFGSTITTDTRPDKIPTLSDVLAKIDKMAEDMATQQVKHFYTVINEATEKTGNVTHGNFKKDGAKVFNDAFEKLTIDFDDGGKPRLPSLVVGPELFETLMQQKEAIETDTAENERMKEIIARKREEFRARESNRKLVS